MQKVEGSKALLSHASAMEDKGHMYHGVACQRSDIRHFKNGAVDDGGGIEFPCFNAKFFQVHKHSIELLKVAPICWGVASLLVILKLLSGGVHVLAEGMTRKLQE